MDITDYDSRSVLVPGTEVLRETDKALLIRFSNDQELWIPQSQLHEDSEVFEMGHAGDLIISRWIAELKELL